MWSSLKLIALKIYQRHFLALNYFGDLYVVCSLVLRNPSMDKSILRKASEAHVDMC